MIHITSLREAHSYLEKLVQVRDHVVIDLETTGLDPHKDRILAIVVSGLDSETAAYIDGEHVSALQGLETAKRLVLHNFKFDFNFLRRAGVSLPTHGVVFDTMLVHHLLDENASHGLDSIIQEEFHDGYKARFWEAYKTFEEAPLEARIAYACKDVIYTDRVYRLFNDRLLSVGTPLSLVEHVHRLAFEFFEFEYAGIKVDLEYTSTVGAKLKTRILELKTEMREAALTQVESVEYAQWLKAIDKYKTVERRQRVARPEFNFDSSRQLMDLLYTQLKLPAQKNKKTKQPTADDDALEKLDGKHPVVTKIREYRGHAKVFGSYIEGTLERMIDGRIYPQLHVNGTVTGRASSSDPNLHQLPRDGGVRGIYVPDPEHYLLSCDYRQLEVAIAAHFSQDPNLLKIIHEGASKHDITAEGVGLPRQTAKTLNFAMQYLCSPRKVAEIVGCSQAEGQFIWNKYWETYAKEKEVVDACKALVDRGQPIVNPFGRRRRFPTEFRASWERERAYRQAYSSLVQGTGADVTHRAYYSAADTYRVRGLGRVLFEVHDEILAMPKKSCWQEAKNVVEYEMIQAGRDMKLNVPLSTDCSDALERWVK